MIQPKRINYEEATAALGAEFNLDSETTYEPSDQLIAELLRATLCALTFPLEGSLIWRPVYVTRLVNAVFRRLELFWHPEEDFNIDKHGDDEAEQDERTGIRRMLEYLEEIRDVIDCGDGFRLPSPIRFVKLPVGQVLILGGFSTPDLRKAVTQAIQYDGFARCLVGPDPVIEDERWQSLENWRGPIPDLREWTRATLEIARRNLMQSALDFTDFEIYSVETERSKLHYYRWVRPDEMSHSPSNLVLCRSIRGLPREYWFGRLRTTKSCIVLDRQSPVQTNLVTRLQFGLDLEAGLPTRAVVSREEHCASVFLPNRLPPEERRTLRALTATSVDLNRPRIECVISVQSLPEVIAMLHALGIHISHR